MSIADINDSLLREVVSLFYRNGGATLRVMDKRRGRRTNRNIKAHISFDRADSSHNEVADIVIMARCVPSSRPACVATVDKTAPKLSGLPSLGKILTGLVF